MSLHVKRMSSLITVAHCHHGAVGAYVLLYITVLFKAEMHNVFLKIVV